MKDGDPARYQPKGAFLQSWFHQLNRGRIRTVFHALFRLFCWWAVVWLVWNHAMSDFLNAGRITLWQSLGMSILLMGLAAIFEDAETDWDGRTSTRFSR